MTKRTICDVDVSGKRLVVRVDLNVPLRDDGTVANDRRIRAALPTVRHCVENHASPVLITHLGRPGGKRDPRLSLRRVADRLQEFLDETPVRFVADVAGDDARRSVDALKPAEVLVLDNLRFDSREKTGDEHFARALRALGEVYVNDAFAACHRKHASMFATARLFPERRRAIGLLVHRELRVLGGLLKTPQHPLVAVLGGAKVADKLGTIDALLAHADKVLIGGAMAYPFMKAKGLAVGASKVENDKLDVARQLLERGGQKLVLPQDHVVARKPASPDETKVVEGAVPDGWYGLDIGPRTIEQYTSAVRGAASVVWNGPLGKFEDEAFRKGTDAVVRAMAESNATTIIGGGESGEAVERLQLVHKMDHVSTGGGAFLKYLECGTLPALEAIDDK